MQSVHPLTLLYTDDVALANETNLVLQDRMQVCLDQLKDNPKKKK